MALKRTAGGSLGSQYSANLEDILTAQPRNRILNIAGALTLTGRLQKDDAFICSMQLVGGAYHPGGKVTSRTGHTSPL